MPNLMILGALAASLVLVFRSGERIPAFIALAAAALEALIAFRLVTIKGPPSLGLILAAALTLAGVLVMDAGGLEAGRHGGHRGGPGRRHPGLLVAAQGLA